MLTAGGRVLIRCVRQFRVFGVAAIYNRKFQLSSHNLTKMSPVPNVKFNNGQEFPIFGLGTWKVFFYYIKWLRFYVKKCFLALKTNKY